MQKRHYRRAGCADDHSVETADAVARAAHIWVRSLCLTEKQEPGERLAMASGLITGLCDRLELDARIKELVAYVYALLDDQGCESLATSRVMLQQSVTQSHLPAFRKGMSEATAIIEMFAYHEKRS